MTQNGTNETLSGRDLKLLEALFGGASVVDAAASVGISRRQAYRVIETPVFSAELKRRQSEVLELVARRLSVLAVDAVDALGSILDDPGQRGAGNKRLAAVAVLSVLHEWHELVDIEHRLSQLEERSNRGGTDVS